MTPSVLYHIPLSPWSERARWVLDHHHLPYTAKEYVPMLGEPLLRRKLGKHAPRKITLPVLLSPDHAPLTDSTAIARWVDAQGDPSRSLGLETHQEAIQTWIAHADATLEASRAILLKRMYKNPRAWRATVPDVFPAWSKGALAPAARQGIGYLCKKYDLWSRDDAADTAQIVRHFEALRDGLAQSGSPYLIDDRFGYADIVMASALKFIRPYGEHHDAALADIESLPELADQLSDLLAWRDRLYDQHRPTT